MNYRHVYHAGNFADVFKHIVLVALLQALARKDKPYCYLDTHAGIGLYDLQHAHAQKSREFQQGIATLLKQDNPPALVSDYLACVSEVNTPSTLRYYPGSPMIARQLLRHTDRMVLTELHPEDYATLHHAFVHDRRVGVHHLDGYQGLKAFLPPKERRGLVLIDPPYEKPDELSTVVSQLANAVMRWETGTFALWYPIKESRSIVRFHRALKLNILRPLLAIDFCLYPDSHGTALNGCGMAIINPPWQLAETLEPVVAWLWRALSPSGQGRFTLKAL